MGKTYSKEGKADVRIHGQLLEDVSVKVSDNGIVFVTKQPPNGGVLTASIHMVDIKWKDGTSSTILDAL